MFTSAGEHKVRITEVTFAEPKFAQGPNDFDICIRVESLDDPAQADYWRGEWSQNYGKGNFATQTQAEITMSRLRRVGFEGDDLTTLESQLVGVETVAFIKEREYEGKTYYDVASIGAAANTPQKIDAATMQARLQAQMSQAPSAATGGTAPKAPAGANPFAK